MSRNIASEFCPRPILQFFQFMSRSEGTKDIEQYPRRFYRVEPLCVCVCVGMRTCFHAVKNANI